MSMKIPVHQTLFVRLLYSLLLFECLILLLNEVSSRVPVWPIHNQLPQKVNVKPCYPFGIRERHGNQLRNNHLVQEHR